MTSLHPGEIARTRIEEYVHFFRPAALNKVDEHAYLGRGTDAAEVIDAIGLVPRVLQL